MFHTRLICFSSGLGTYRKGFSVSLTREAMGGEGRESLPYLTLRSMNCMSVSMGRREAMAAKAC